jgi:hypothetical protein
MPANKTPNTTPKSSATKTVHVHGHWRHYDNGDKTYIAPATRHVKKK